MCSQYRAFFGFWMENQIGFDRKPSLTADYTDVPIEVVVCIPTVFDFNFCAKSIVFGGNHSAFDREIGALFISIQNVGIQSEALSPLR